MNADALAVCLWKLTILNWNLNVLALDSRIQWEKFFFFYHIYSLHMKSSLYTIRSKVSRSGIDLNMVSLSEQKGWISRTQK